MTGGIIDRFRSLPIRPTGVLTGHVVAQHGAQRRLHRAGHRDRVPHRVRRRRVPLEWVAAIGLIALFVLALTWVAVAIGIVASGPEAASGFTFAILFLPVRVQRVRAAGVDARRCWRPSRRTTRSPPITDTAARAAARHAGRGLVARGACCGASGSSSWVGSRPGCCSVGAAEPSSRRRPRGPPDRAACLSSGHHSRPENDPARPSIRARAFVVVAGSHGPQQQVAVDRRLDGQVRSARRTPGGAPGPRPRRRSPANRYTETCACSSGQSRPSASAAPTSSAVGTASVSWTPVVGQAQERQDAVALLGDAGHAVSSVVGVTWRAASPWPWSSRPS